MVQPFHKPVLIAGGGLSSLLLAQALRCAAIPFQIYERDASLSFRAQGYRLRLSAQGLDAIESVLSREDYSGRSHRVGTCPSTSTHARIGRQRLRDTFTEWPSARSPVARWESHWNQSGSYEAAFHERVRELGAVESSSFRV
jgi:2-polyprenyl-6-methoxyphenol hydroxylase-like FAD-dependent oxidoreductase